MPVIKITTKKDGRQAPWFREASGRVRTSVGADWTKAEQLRELGEYGIQLQLEQTAAGFGSDGQPMPPLRGSGVAVFTGRVGGKARFERRGYAQQKAKFGGRPIRDLRGPGVGGHMLDAIRINFLDDKRCSFAITTNQARIKANANERRADWWGWSPQSVAKLSARAAVVFQQGIEERLVQLGLMGAVSIAGAGRFLRRVA